MCTIPDQLYDRLANARITVEDGAQLIALFDVLPSAAQRCLSLEPWTVDELTAGGAR